MVGKVGNEVVLVNKAGSLRHDMEKASRRRSPARGDKVAGRAAEAEGRQGRV